MRRVWTTKVNSSLMAARGRSTTVGAVSARLPTVFSLICHCAFLRVVVMPSHDSLTSPQNVWHMLLANIGVILHFGISL